MQIHFDPGQIDFIHTCFQRSGWYAITGPRLSGKTCRVLHCAHNFPKEDKDFIWINFDNINSEVEAIARVAQQLCFRKCHTIADLDDQMRRLLVAVKARSVVVLDNIQVNERRLSAVGSSADGGPSLQACNVSARQQVVSFLKRFVAMCKVHGGTLSFVVIADDCEPFRTVVPFVDELVIGEMSNPDDLILTLQHTVGCVLCWHPCVGSMPG